MSEKLYSIADACRIFNIPRSVLANGVINGAIETTLRFDTAGSRCRRSVCASVRRWSRSSAR
jgi:hypothetical protein